jgi:hypothetical protein
VPDERSPRGGGSPPVGMTDEGAHRARNSVRDSRRRLSISILKSLGRCMAGFLLWPCMLALDQSLLGARRSTSTSQLQGQPTAQPSLTLENEPGGRYR